jgi:protein phosphatase
MRARSAGASDIGRRRPHNEDAWFTDDQLGLFIVADGVGGHAKGEIASQETVEQIAMWVRRHQRDIDEAIARGNEGHGEVRRLLESGVQSACYMVFGMAEMDPEKKGMSTTLTAMLVREGFVFTAQVGDSRVYRLRQGALSQLTEDHTLINYKLKHGLITPEEAKRAQGKNVITRAVGHKDYVQVDTAHDHAAPGDRYLLCTDGLHGYLDKDDEVIELMRVDPIAEGARKSIEWANGRGGKDNITAIIVSIEE